MIVFWTRALLTAALIFGLQMPLLWWVRVPISGEYFVRELIIIKEHLGARSAAPRLIVLGGSATWFGIDTEALARLAGRPAVNMGLHAGLRLETILDEGRKVARSGDTIILMLEPGYYGDHQLDWTSWQIMNALAWDPGSIDRLPGWKRFQLLARAQAAGASWDILGTLIAQRRGSPEVARRLASMAPPPEIVGRYESGAFKMPEWIYCPYNIGGTGDVAPLRENLYHGAGVRHTEPGAVTSRRKEQLRDFVREMKERGVRVLVANTPYIVEERLDYSSAEDRFAADIREIGSEVIEPRGEAMFPRADFYNTNLHLTAEGRRVRTERLAARIRQALESARTR